MFGGIKALHFWTAAASEATDDMNTSFMAALAAINPKLFGRADIDVGIDGLKQLGQHIEAYRRKHKEAKKAYDAAQQLNSQRIGSVKIMQGQLTDPATPDNVKKTLPASIQSQLDKIKSAQPTLDLLRTKEQTMLRAFSMEDGAYQAKFKEMMARKDELETATAGQDIAQQELELAKERNAVATEVSGLKQASSDDPVKAALVAVQEKTNKLKDQAASLNRLSDNLETSSHDLDDPNVAASMAQAAGSPVANASIADQLAELEAAQQKRNAA